MEDTKERSGKTSGSSWLPLWKQF